MTSTLAVTSFAAPASIGRARPSAARRSPGGGTAVVKFARVNNRGLARTAPVARAATVADIKDGEVKGGRIWSLRAEMACAAEEALERAQARFGNGNAPADRGSTTAPRAASSASNAGDKTEADVAIVGGGPAGLCAAKKLAESGGDFLLPFGEYPAVVTDDLHTGEFCFEACREAGYCTHFCGTRGRCCKDGVPADGCPEKGAMCGDRMFCCTKSATGRSWSARSTLAASEAQSEKELHEAIEAALAARDLAAKSAAVAEAARDGAADAAVSSDVAKSKGGVQGGGGRAAKGVVDRR